MKHNFEAGYYINSKDQLAIIYPNMMTYVWIEPKNAPDEWDFYDGKVGFWYCFIMNTTFKSVFQWERIGDL